MITPGVKLWCACFLKSYCKCCKLLVKPFFVTDSIVTIRIMLCTFPHNLQCDVDCKNKKFRHVPTDLSTTESFKISCWTQYFIFLSSPSSKSFSHPLSPRNQQHYRITLLDWYYSRVLSYRVSNAAFSVRNVLQSKGCSSKGLIWLRFFGTALSVVEICRPVIDRHIIVTFSQ